MLSKDHIQLSVLSALLPVILAVYWIALGPAPSIVGITTAVNGIALILAGVFIGSLLPDTDLDTSKIDKMYKYKVNTSGMNIGNKIVVKILASVLGIVTFIIGEFTKYILNPVVATLFAAILRKKINRNHRGVTHSIFGIIVNCLIIGAILFVISYATELSTIIVLLAPGIFIGEVLHIVEDSCTVSGISPLYPLWGQKKISGNIHTGDEKDRRPLYYIGIIFASDLAIGIPVWKYQITDYGTYFLLSVVELVVAWMIILLISHVTIKDEEMKEK